MAYAPGLPVRPHRPAGFKFLPLVNRFARFLRSLLRRFTPSRLPRSPAGPSVAMLPNPCLATDILMLHLRGLRCCPTQIKVVSSTGEVVLEREVFPLSNHHRLPLQLPINSPAGMYHCVAVQPGGTAMKTWLALMD